jgi:hypothetical protein
MAIIRLIILYFTRPNRGLLGFWSRSHIHNYPWVHFLTLDFSWEMSTIGHPLSDLVNLLMPYTMANETTHFTSSSLPRFREGTTPGLPTQSQLLQWYAEVGGYDPNPDLPWGVAFGFFRATCIYQGIAARWAQRQASSAKAKENGKMMWPMAELAWKYVVKAKGEGKEKGVSAKL